MIRLRRERGAIGVRIRTVALLLVALVAACGAARGHYVRSSAAASPARLPADVPFDYQIGGDSSPDAGVGVVARDWFEGQPAAGSYGICYVNAFQTQDDDPDQVRPDERSAWPADLVRSDLGDDPVWGGEYLIDLSSADTRARAADWVAPMLRVCAEKGFDAVELDNLDSWTRFDGTPLAAEVGFGADEAISFAELLVDEAHRLGLAAAQKNTVELGRAASLDVVGFDLAVVEECGLSGGPDGAECRAFATVFDDAFVVVEYTDDGFVAACAAVGDRVSVVRRDLLVTPAGHLDHVREEC